MNYQQRANVAWQRGLFYASHNLWNLHTICLRQWRKFNELHDKALSRP